MSTDRYEEVGVKKSLVETAAQAMLAAADFFHQQGWLLGTCGNLSIQLTPKRLLVTPSGRDKSPLQLDDLLIVDERGANVLGLGKATAELSVHQEIYRRTSARAVYHVHSIPNNLASRLWRQQGQVVFEGIEMIKGIAGKALYDRISLPIAANHDGMGELAALVAQALSVDVPAVLVYQHGIYAWGDSPETARRHVEIFEFLLDYVVRLRQLGLEVGS